MPLLFTGTWEHALLAATVREAAQSEPGGYLGRTAVQKILYFVQVAGVPMRYTFDLYHYGPYCDRISRDVELLLADQALRDASSSEKYSNYRPAAGADELLGAHASALQPHRETIARVVRSLLPLQPDHLEILATLDYLYRQLKAGGGTGPWKERVVARFQQVKKDKFTAEQVAAAYDTMVGAGFIEA